MTRMRLVMAGLVGLFATQAMADSWGFSFRYGRSRCDDVVSYRSYRDCDTVVYRDCSPRYYDRVVYSDCSPRVYVRDCTPLVVRDRSPRVYHRSYRPSYYRSTRVYHGGSRHYYSNSRSWRYCD